MTPTLADVERALGLPIGFEEKRHIVHIHIDRPRFVKFVARVRRWGYRRYEVVRVSRSRRVAYQALAVAMVDRKYKRGDVLGEEGPYSYYEPMVLVEMTN